MIHWVLFPPSQQPSTRTFYFNMLPPYHHPFQHRTQPQNTTRTQQSNPPINLRHGSLFGLQSTQLLPRLQELRIRHKLPTKQTTNPLRSLTMSSAYEAFCTCAFRGVLERVEAKAFWGLEVIHDFRGALILGLDVSSFSARFLLGGYHILFFNSSRNHHTQQTTVGLSLSLGELILGWPEVDLASSAACTVCISSSFALGTAFVGLVARPEE